MMSEREADEEAKHGEVLRWSPTVHYVTTGLCAFCFFFWRPFLTYFLFILAPDDESKCQDSAEAKSQDGEETKTQEVEEDNRSDDGEDNTPIAASIIAEAGYGCIAALHAEEQTGTTEPTIKSVDIQWLMANRYERHVNVKRLTVVRQQTHQYT